MIDYQRKEIKTGQKFCIGRIEMMAILAGMLLPALNSAREKGREVSCKSNLKQIHLGAMLYNQDFKEWNVTELYSSKLIEGRKNPVPWFLMYQHFGYMKAGNVFRCPTNASNVKGVSSDDGGYNYGTTYGVTGGTFGSKAYTSGAGRPIKTPELLRAKGGNQVVFFADTANVTGTVNSKVNSFECEAKSKPGTSLLTFNNNSAKPFRGGWDYSPYGVYLLHSGRRSANYVNFSGSVMVFKSYGATLITHSIFRPNRRHDDAVYGAGKTGIFNGVNP